MKFMLLCYDDEQHWAKAGDAALKAAMQEAVQLTHELHGKRQYILASPLAGSSTARTVRVRDGKQITTDGPYAETREVLGGFYLIDVPTLEHAVAIAARHSGVHVGAVEVRQVMELPGLPQK